MCNKQGGYKKRYSCICGPVSKLQRTGGISELGQHYRTVGLCSNEIFIFKPTIVWNKPQTTPGFIWRNPKRTCEHDMGIPGRGGEAGVETFQDKHAGNTLITTVKGLLVTM